MSAAVVNVHGDGYRRCSRWCLLLLALPSPCHQCNRPARPALSTVSMPVLCDDQTPRLIPSVAVPGPRSPNAARHSSIFLSFPLFSAIPRQLRSIQTNQSPVQIGQDDNFALASCAQVTSPPVRCSESHQKWNQKDQKAQTVGGSHLRSGSAPPSTTSRIAYWSGSGTTPPPCLVPTSS